MKRGRGVGPVRIDPAVVPKSSSGARVDEQLDW